MTKTLRPVAELILDLADKLADAAQRDLGVQPARARQFGDKVAALVAKDWGGQNFYFPKDVAFVIAKRDAEIYAKFTGSNQSALAKEYDMTVRHIYRIVEEQRALRLPRQHSLLDL